MNTSHTNATTNTGTHPEAGIRAKLKAERVQGKAVKRAPARSAVTEAEQKLKAERVQQKLAGLPGWVQDRNGLLAVRVRDFAHNRRAAVYAGLAAQLADLTARPLGVATTGRRVVLVLPLQARHGCSAVLAREDRELALMLSLKI